LFAADFEKNFKLILLSQDLNQMLVSATLVSVTSVRRFNMFIFLSKHFSLFIPIFLSISNVMASFIYCKGDRL